MVRIFALLVALIAPPASAQDTSPATVQFLPGWRDARAGDHVAAISITLAEGWKTYWRAPGDAGIPPYWTWTVTENVAGLGFHWPIPEVSFDNGMRSIGYSDSLVLPMRIIPEDISRPIRLAGTVQIGVCETICIPMDFSFDVTLPAGGDRDGAIVAALLDRPLSAASAGIAEARCGIAAMDDGLLLSIAVPHGLTQGDAVVIEAGDPSVWVSEPQVTATAAGFVAQSRLYSSDRSPIALDRSAVVLTIIGANSAIEIRGCAAG